MGAPRRADVTGLALQTRARPPPISYEEGIPGGSLTVMLEFMKLLLTIVLGSGAAITIAKLVFDRQKEARERTEALDYLAIQLAFQF
jgi:hypothetical protein